MDDNLRDKLKEMVKSYDGEETTNNIREEKNSRKIYNDVQKILHLKSKYMRLKKSNFSQFRKMAISKCNFLFINFTNIFNRLLKDELDLKILFNMIQILEKIENNDIDQHEGSAMIGLILKKLYIDPIIKPKKKLKKPPNAKSNISWNDYKKSNIFKNNI